MSKKPVKGIVGKGASTPASMDEFMPNFTAEGMYEILREAKAGGYYKPALSGEGSSFEEIMARYADVSAPATDEPDAKED